jgi:hypothetical protein
MGALTLTIVYNPEEKAIVKPNRVERSRTGSHGQHIYCLPPDVWDKLWVIRLEISNTGKRNVVFSKNIPQGIAHEVTTQWLAGATIDAIIKTLRSA